MNKDSFLDPYVSRCVSDEFFIIFLNGKRPSYRKTTRDSRRHTLWGIYGQDPNGRYTCVVTRRPERQWRRLTVRWEEGRISEMKEREKKEERKRGKEEWKEKEREEGKRKERTEGRKV